jgi:hypothetical protein
MEGVDPVQEPTTVDGGVLENTTLQYKRHGLDNLEPVSPGIIL